MANLQFSESFGRLMRIGEEPGSLGRSTILEIHDAMERGDVPEAERLLESFRYEQQMLQDVYVDWIWAMLTWVQQNVSEEAVGTIMRETLGSWSAPRYAGFLDWSFEERLAQTVEGMRGHLSGPGRIGNIGVVDEGNRVVISFDPCGSGGRARRGDADRGIPGETERADFGSSAEAHDWTWGKSDVCLYCSHCSLVNEIIPIETIGFPIRVTEYPQDRDDPCRWIMYKDPHDVPAEAYERVGKTKPTAEELEAKWAALRAAKGPDGS